MSVLRGLGFRWRSNSASTSPEDKEAPHVWPAPRQGMRRVGTEGDILNAATSHSRESFELKSHRHSFASLRHPKAHVAKQLRIKEQIGEGTCGKVFRAYFNGAEVALKILKTVDEFEAQGTCPVDAAATFRQEMDILGRCAHPKIIALIEGNFQHEGRDAMVLELMKCNLEEYFERRKSVFTGPFRAPATLVVEWAFDIAQAIKCLHGMAPKIIHRDIKPRNVLIAFNNAAILSDMGLCKVNIVNQPVSIHLRICLDISIDMALCEQTVEKGKSRVDSIAIQSTSRDQVSCGMYGRLCIDLRAPPVLMLPPLLHFQRSNRPLHLQHERGETQTDQDALCRCRRARERRQARYYSFRDR